MTERDNNNLNLPSVGTLIEKHFVEHRIRKAALARTLGNSENFLIIRRRSENATVHWLWKLSNALHHNFIADIAVLLPPDYSGGLQDAIAAKEKEIESLKSELEAVAKERDIYKDLLKK